MEKSFAVQELSGDEISEVSGSWAGFALVLIAIALEEPIKGFVDGFISTQ